MWNEEELQLIAYLQETGNSEPFVSCYGGHKSAMELGYALSRVGINIVCTVGDWSVVMMWCIF